MSSWIPSLFNPSSSDDENPTTTPSSGVKEDLSSVFRGVTAFLAPPPATTTSSSDAISGIKNDLAEIQGSFKSGLSLISSKLTSKFLQYQTEEVDDDVSEEGDVVGINEEVVDFVRKIVGRSELWTDFPISLRDDFDLSDYQREHAASIDHLVPDLMTLRQKLCNQINDCKFWLIYFILLFPRLDEEDLKLLSTPEVVKARGTLLKKLQSNSDVAQETTENPGPSDSSDDNSVRVHRPQSGEEGTSQNKDETINEPKQQAINETESGHHSEVDTSKQSENTDYSFSDLEDDVNNSPRVLREWTQTEQKARKSASRDKQSEGEDSNDWLTVDDTDFDNLAEI